MLVDPDGGLGTCSTTGGGVALPTWLALCRKRSPRRLRCSPRNLPSAEFGPLVESKPTACAVRPCPPGARCRKAVVRSRWTKLRGCPDQPPITKVSSGLWEHSARKPALVSAGRRQPVPSAVGQPTIWSQSPWPPLVSAHLARPHHLRSQLVHTARRRGPPANLGRPGPVIC